MVMFIKNFFGIGLAAQIANCIDKKAAKDGYFIGQVVCTLQKGVLPGTLRKWTFYAQPISDYYRLRPFQYEKAYPNFRELINGLTVQISDAQRQFPTIQFVRQFNLPSEAHKNRLYEPNQPADEDWFEKAILDARRDQRSGRLEHFLKISEEFVNGSWSFMEANDVRYKWD